MEDFRTDWNHCSLKRETKYTPLKNNAEILASPQCIIWNSQTHKALHSQQKHAKKALETKAEKVLV